MTTPREKAETFRALHRGPRAFVLPNAWDAASARLFEDSGFAAVATSSAGLMVSRGFRDGEEMPRRELTAEVGRIASRLRIPLSADIVAGYGPRPRDVVTTVRGIVAAGAIGINLEDRRPSGGGLFPVADQVGKIRAVREFAERIGVPIVINGRTDALRVEPEAGRSPLESAIERARAYREAGADCVYPMGLAKPDEIERFVGAVDAPVNVMVRPGLPPLAELERLGVRRVSFGPAASYAAFGLLRRACREVLDRGTFSALTEGALNHDELNRLAAREP